MRIVTVAMVVMAAGCASREAPLTQAESVPPVALVTGVERPAPGGPVWLVGIARSAKLGAVVEAGGQVVSCDGEAAWPPDVEGRPIVVAGAMTTRSAPPLPIGPRGERSAGIEGEVAVLAPCRVPPPDPDAALVAAERALFAALARRDRPALERITTPDLVLRIPGQPDLDRASFLQAVTATPGEILTIDGEHVIAHRAGDLGIVRGVQVARVRLDGKLIEDRGAFVDVFERRGGAWRLRFALNVPISAPVP